MAESEPEGLEYQLYVLNQMIEALPDDIATLLGTQLKEVQKALRIRNRALFIYIIDQLQDVRLSVLNMDFDLTATKREKEELEKRLKDSGLL